MTPTAANAAEYLEEHGHDQLASAVYLLLAENAHLRGVEPISQAAQGRRALPLTTHRADDEVAEEVYRQWSMHPQFPFERPSIHDVRVISKGGNSRAARIRELVRKTYLRRLTDAAKAEKPS